MSLLNRNEIKDKLPFSSFILHLNFVIVSITHTICFFAYLCQFVPRFYNKYPKIYFFMGIVCMYDVCFVQVRTIILFVFLHLKNENLTL